MAIAAHLPLASGGSFLITPNVGLMVWTLVVFLISFFVLRKWVFPPLRAAIDARAQRINDSIDAAEHTREEADQLLADYRERLKEARGQADEIIARARTAAEAHERSATEEAKLKRDQLMEQTRRDIEAETRRAIQEIRNEVADLTVLATEKVTRKTLTEDDQRRLIEDAMSELDFSALGATEGRTNYAHGRDRTGLRARPVRGRDRARLAGRDPRSARRVLGRDARQP
jgi:F-type H+-transporting ATPase subunit b